MPSGAADGWIRAAASGASYQPSLINVNYGRNLLIGLNGTRRLSVCVCSTSWGWSLHLQHDCTNPTEWHIFSAAAHVTLNNLRFPFGRFQENVRNSWSMIFEYVLKNIEVELGNEGNPMQLLPHDSVSVIKQQKYKTRNLHSDRNEATPHFISLFFNFLSIVDISVHFCIWKEQILSHGCRQTCVSKHPGRESIPYSRNWCSNWKNHLNRNGFHRRRRVPIFVSINNPSPFTTVRTHRWHWAASEIRLPHVRVGTWTFDRHSC